MKSVSEPSHRLAFLWAQSTPKLLYTAPQMMAAEPQNPHTNSSNETTVPTQTLSTKTDRVSGSVAPKSQVPRRGQASEGQWHHQNSMMTPPSQSSARGNWMDFQSLASRKPWPDLSLSIWRHNIFPAQKRNDIQWLRLPRGKSLHLLRPRNNVAGNLTAERPRSLEFCHRWKCNDFRVGSPPAVRQCVSTYPNSSFCRYGATRSSTMIQYLWISMQNPVPPSIAIGT